MFVFLALAGAVLRRSSALGDIASDWFAMFVFAALGFAAIFAGVVADWNEGGETVLVGGAASAALAGFAAFSQLLHRFTRGAIGSTTSRWLLYAAAAAVAALGWGELAGARVSPGDGRIDSWVIAPIAAAQLAMIFCGLLATRRLIGSQFQLAPLLLFLGLLLFGAGLLTCALGEVLVGSGLSMAGGGLVYTGLASVASLAPAEAPPLVRPRVERESRGRPATGVKVRIPKGDAVRVSTYSDTPSKGDERD
jgi:hypothetical protein